MIMLAHSFIIYADTYVCVCVCVCVFVEMLCV